MGKNKSPPPSTDSGIFGKHNEHREGDENDYREHPRDKYAPKISYGSPNTSNKKWSLKGGKKIKRYFGNIFHGQHGENKNGKKSEQKTLDQQVKLELQISLTEVTSSLIEISGEDTDTSEGTAYDTPSEYCRAFTDSISYSGKSYAEESCVSDDSNDGHDADVKFRTTSAAYRRRNEKALKEFYNRASRRLTVSNFFNRSIHH